MAFWDHTQDFLTPKSYLPEVPKSNMRCKIDKLFGCKHMRNSKKSEFLIDSYGDPYANRTLMPPPPKVSSPITIDANDNNKVRVATDESFVHKRILVPPRVSCGASAPRWETRVSSVVRTDALTSEADSALITCAVCQAKVDVSAITVHLKDHMDDYKEDDSKPLNSNAHSMVPSIPLLPPKAEPPTIRLSTKERYQPRRISNISFSSSVGRNGRYSDFSIVLWETSRPALNDHTHISNAYSASYSNEVVRLQIVITHDALEDYYHLSAKLIKKAWYNETDEGAIPDRICEGSKELFTEVRRALIYFRINPKTVYRIFRKMQYHDKFVSEYDKDGRAFASHTSNTESLMDQLKHTATTNTQYNGCYH